MKKIKQVQTNFRPQTTRNINSKPSLRQKFSIGSFNSSKSSAKGIKTARINLSMSKNFKTENVYKVLGHKSKKSVSSQKIMLLEQELKSLKSGYRSNLSQQMSSFDETIEQIPTIQSKQRDINVSEFKYFLNDHD